MSCVGAKVVEVANIEGLLEILRMGENNRVVANQRLNATSSRSHSMLMINIHRLPKQSDGVSLVDSVTVTKGAPPLAHPTARPVLDPGLVPRQHERETRRTR